MFLNKYEIIIKPVSGHIYSFQAYNGLILPADHRVSFYKQTWIHVNYYFFKYLEIGFTSCLKTIW